MCRIEEIGLSHFAIKPRSPSQIEGSRSIKVPAQNTTQKVNKLIRCEIYHTLLVNKSNRPTPNMREENLLKVTQQAA